MEIPEVHNTDDNDENTQTKIGAKILEVINSYPVPANIHNLEWEVDFGEQNDAFQLLGPRPRRSALYSALRELAFDGRIMITDEGIVSVKSGSANILVDGNLNPEDATSSGIDA